MATPTSRLKLKKQTLGSNLNQWGLSGGLNGAFDQVDVLAGYLEVNLGSATSYTFGTTNYATTGNEHMYRAVKFSGSPSSGVTVNIPAVDDFKFVENATGQTITFSNGSTTATLANTFTGYIRTNGSSVITVLTLPDGVNVKTVADNIASVNQVATDSASVIAVAGKSTEIGRLGTVDAVADMALLGTTANVAAQALLGTSANVTAQGHLGTSANVTAQGHLGTSANVAAQALIGTSANVAAQALIGTSANVAAQALIGTSANIAIQALMGTTANIAAQALIGTTANVAAQALIGTTANVDAQALIGTSANITAQALIGTSANVAAQALIGTSANVAAQALIGTTANVNAQALIGTSANIAVQALLGTSANVAAMALLGTSSNITNMSNLGTTQNVSNMNTLAPISGDITTTAGVSTAVTAYSKQYSAGNGDISTRADGTGTVAEGDLRFRTDTDTMRVYNGSAWEDAAPGAGNYYTKSDSDTRYAQVSNNLSDVTATTARTNLGLDSLLAAKAPLASPALTGSATLNGVAIATGTSDSTLGTLTQAFTAGQQTTINLSSNALSPSVAVTKEVPQTGVTNNQWNVDSAGSGNYTRYNTAPATTISFSGTTATLGSGSFSASDVGKTIEVNNGKLILTNVNGTFSVASTPDNYNQAASGAWQMYGLKFNTADTDLEVSNTLTNAYDLSTAVWSKKYDHVGVTQPNAMEWVDSGTKLFVLNTFNNTVYSYTASTPYDVGSLVYVDQRTVSSGDNSNMGMAVKPDGTVLYVIGTQWNAVYSFNMTTPFDLSSAPSQYNSYFSCNTQLSGGSVSAHSLFFKPDGTAFYVNGYSTATGRVYQYNLNTAWDITTASYSNYGPAVVNYNQGLTFNSDGTRFYIGERGGKTIRTYQINNTPWSLYDVSGPIASFSVSSHIDYPDGLTFNNDGSRFYVTGPSRDDIVQWDVGSLLAPSGYHAAHTTNSIDSSTWTDINSMTATDSAGTGTVNYAVSTDDRTTWKIAHNTSGARNIVKNASGTWQYNSNGTYGSETWVNGSTNNELATLQQAMEGAVSVTNAYAISNATAGYGAVFSVSTYMSDPRDIEFSADGLKMFTVGRTVNAVVEWHLSTAFDSSTAVYDSNFSVSSQEANPTALAFKPDGTKMYVAGPTTGSLQEYNLSTAFDVSTASYVQGFAIFNQAASPEGIAFNNDGTKVFISGTGNDGVREWSLSTAYDVSTMSYTRALTGLASSNLGGIAFNADGTEMYLGFCNNFDRLYKYQLSTAFDISTASVTTYVDLGSYQNDMRGICFNPSGTKLFTIDPNLDRVSQYTLGSSSFANQMNKTQLDAVSDANQFGVSDDLDLAIILNLPSGTGVPSSDGVSINYDANVANQGAILGPNGDYTYDVPALNKIRITAVNAATLKIRVV